MKEFFKKPIGIIKCYNIDENGKIIDTIFEEKNLIVASGVELLRNFLIGDEVKGIKYIAVGDMNLSKNDNLYDVRPPASIDYKLENEVFRKEVEKKIYEDTDYVGVTFEIIIEKNECNGNDGKQIITELGLLSSSVYISEEEDKNQRNILFSRKTRSAIIKDYKMRLKFEWSILFEKNQIE